jgi:hypothetical protein
MSLGIAQIQQINDSMCNMCFASSENAAQDFIEWSAIRARVSEGMKVYVIVLVCLCVGGWLCRYVTCVCVSSICVFVSLALEDARKYTSTCLFGQNCKTFCSQYTCDESLSSCMRMRVCVCVCVCARAPCPCARVLPCAKIHHMLSSCPICATCAYFPILMFTTRLQVGEGLEASSYLELEKTCDFFDYKKSSPSNMYGGALLAVGIIKGRMKCQFKVKNMCGGVAIQYIHIYIHTAPRIKCHFLR